MGRFRIGSIVLLALSIFLLSAAPAYSEEEQAYYLGELTNAGLDTGYSEYNQVKESEPQYGWSLGTFYMTGFTSVSRGDSPTFLKTAGDTAALHFKLNQDIDALDGNENLSIADDSNGYDQPFGVEKQDFGRGTFIVRQTNYQNSTSDPQVYVDFLAATASKDADTEIQLFEEGDYEATLDYEIRNDPRKMPVVGLSIFPEYTDYHITFSFSVRNGNTMVFLFDTATGSELTNESLTENGFYIDMAKSRYLDVNVKREAMAGGKDELVEDIRSNAPAEDGKAYTDEGIYTITATNPTTGETTEKKIYVGTDPIMKAYAVTGYSIDEIESQVAQGAEIGEDGTITWAVSESGTDDASAEPSQSAQKEASSNSAAGIGFAIAAAAIIAAALLIVRQRRDPSGKQKKLEAANGKAGLSGIDGNADDGHDQR
jgi:hypothetical protein